MFEEENTAEGEQVPRSREMNAGRCSAAAEMNSSWYLLQENRNEQTVESLQKMSRKQYSMKQENEKQRTNKILECRVGMNRRCRKCIYQK